MRRDIAASAVDTTADTQVLFLMFACLGNVTIFNLCLTVLDNAVKSDPDGWWWIKADGVDVVKGLGESTRGLWWGDVDLNDGKLQQLQLEMGLKDRANGETDLEAILEFTKTDSEFLHRSKY